MVGFVVFVITCIDKILLFLGLTVVAVRHHQIPMLFRGKILLLYKNYKNKYEGWVLPKGTVEEGEEYKSKS